MKTLIAIFVLTLFSQSYAYDLSHRFGLGAGVGFPIPIFGNHFNEVADPEVGMSVYGRYHFNSSVGLDLGVSKEEFKETSMNFRNIDLLTFWRTSGASDFTPILGAGVALTSIKDYQPKSAKLSLLARIGAEYGLMPSLALDALLDYQYVSKIMGEMPSGAAHVLTPKLTLTWYFGSDSSSGTKKEEMQDEKMVDKKEDKEAMLDKTSDIISVESASTMRAASKLEVTIEFDSNKAKIKSEYQERLKKVADQLKENSKLVGVIEGYADSTGSKELNKELSKKRADSIKDRLIEFGARREQVSAEGFGEDYPVATNHTSEGRQANRRADVYIIIQPAAGNVM